MKKDFILSIIVTVLIHIVIFVVTWLEPKMVPAWVAGIWTVFFVCGYIISERDYKKLLARVTEMADGRQVHMPFEASKGASRCGFESHRALHFTRKGIKADMS